MSPVIPMPARQSPIRQDHDQLCAVFDALADGVLVCEPGGSIVEANETACTLFGVARPDILSKNLRHLSPVAAEALDRLKTESLGSATVCEASCVVPGRPPYWAEFALRRLSVGGRSVTAIVIRDISERKQTHDQIAEATRWDFVTGLPNQRGFQEVLEHEIARYERYGGYLCVAIGGIIDFEALAAQRGDAAGEAIVGKVAALLRQRLRKSDYMARCDRSRFAFLIHDTKPDSALRMIRRMQSNIADQPIAELGEPVALSFGVTGYRLSDKPADLLMRVEAALAAAQGDGKGRVVVG